MLHYFERHVTKGKPWELALPEGRIHIRNEGPGALLFNDVEVQNDSYRLNPKNSLDLITRGESPARSRIISDDAKVKLVLRFSDDEDLAAWLLEQRAASLDALDSS